MKIHFIGIGGIGVSALAQYYFAKGHDVSGVDINKSGTIEKLKHVGIKISEVDECDLVIYSPAITKDQLLVFIEKGIKVMSYPQALGELTKEYFTIAISGTHGKSTTTAMISLILIEAGLDPTVIVGTKLKEFGDSNFRMGNSKYLVIEACEYERSFLNYNSDIAVILNIEEDHLDYYKNIEDIYDAFRGFVSLIKPTGVLVKPKELDIKTDKKVINFSPDEINFSLNIPGQHNLIDALAGIKVARELNIADEVSINALSRFNGTWRRFDRHIINNVIFIDDYAHHPTEILTTLKGIREEYSEKKIYCFFQPHQYQRTFLLLDDFVKVFKEAVNIVDKFFIIDIYDVLGRENKEIKEKISSKKIAEVVDGVDYIKKEDVLSEIKNGEVIIFMGAGDIYNLSCDIRKIVI